MENSQGEDQGSNKAPRQIAIEILPEDTPRSSMKILSMPTSSNAPSKVVDFRQITMKSDFNQAILGGAIKDDKSRQDGGSKVITKDMIVHAKEMFTLKKEGQTLRTLLPKPSFLTTTANRDNQFLMGEGNTPVRIKQVSRIGTTGDKVNVIEISSKASTVTPSTSKTSMTSSGGSTRGRRKYSKRSYYAYVTESESEGEEMNKRDASGEVLVTGRRSKRASMSQKLALWGLLPSGREEGEEVMGEMEEEEEERMKMEEEIKSEHELPIKEQDLMKLAQEQEEAEDEEEDEEEDDEPLIEAPPPKFINVPLSEQSKPLVTPSTLSKPEQLIIPPSISAVKTQPTITTPSNDNVIAPTLISKSTVSDVNNTATAATPSTTIQPSSSTEKEINSVLDLEELLSGIEKNKLTAIQPPLYISSVSSMTPLARTAIAGAFKQQIKTPVQNSSSQQTGSTGTQALKTITPSGWLKKASNMLVQNRPAPSFKRMDTMNKSLMCKPIMLTKGTIFNPLRIHKSTQTEEEEVLEKKSMVVPVPVPFYIPAPTTPCLLPSSQPLLFPLPLPIPLPMPTSRTRVSNLIRHMQDQLSAVKEDNALCAMQEDLLQIAEMVSSTKTEQDKQLEEYNASIIRGVNDSTYVYPSLTPPRQKSNKQENYNWLTRTSTGTFPEDAKTFNNVSSVPAYIDSSRGDDGLDKRLAQANRAPNQPLPLNDDRMKLKYSYAMHVWKYWTEMKNIENSKRVGMPKGRVQFFFQSDPLKSSSEQLAGSLAYFVRDVRKVDASKFAPDSIYFLCLGIQYYLRENGRDDSIFSDVIYHKFTESLNEVLASFEMKINSQNMLICRVTEDHLWEAGQLGCLSPHTLLSTLVYFNIKNFLITSVEDHLKLTSDSFEIAYENKEGVVIKKLLLKLDGEHNVVHENTEEPLKCPVRMHQFYISKSPNSYRSFYSLPEFPSKIETNLWYSQNPISKGFLTKIINRCLVVREVQVANLQHMQIEA